MTAMVSATIVIPSYETVRSKKVVKMKTDTIGTSRIKNSEKSRIFGSMLNSLITLSLVVGLFGVFVHSVHAKSLVTLGSGDEWSYFKGNAIPPSNWNHITFDDSKWLIGTGSFGYGDEYFSTVLEDMQNNYEAIFARYEFTMSEQPDESTKIVVSVESDGPFIVYLNGIEAIQSSVRMVEELDISGFAHELLPGTNVLGVHCLNDNINSNSFVFRPSFKITKENEK